MCLELWPVAFLSEKAPRAIDFKSLGLSVHESYCIVYNFPFLCRSLKLFCDISDLTAVSDLVTVSSQTGLFCFEKKEANT